MQVSHILDGQSVMIEYDGGTIFIAETDIVVQRSEMAHMKVLNEGQLTVGFDTEITQELLLEGIARDIVRSVQSLRKESDFDVADRIELRCMGNRQSGMLSICSASISSGKRSRSKLSSNQSLRLFLSIAVITKPSSRFDR